MILSHMYLIQKPVELCMRQRLGLAVGNHIVNKHVNEVDSSNSYLVSNVMMLDINLLCLRVKNRIVNKSNGALIVSSQRDYICNKV